MRGKITKGIVVGVCMLLALVGCSGGKTTPVETKEPVQLYVLAAASLTDAMTEIATLYTQETEGVEIVFSFDSSGTLKRQIEEGAPADLFISAAMKQMNELAEKELVVSDSIIKLLENKVVLIKSTAIDLPITSFEETATDAVEMIAIGNEDVPVGQYTQMIYSHLGLWEVVQKKANLGTNVRQVLDWVATGNVVCGVVYATDAAIEAGVEVICEAPEDATDRVIYPAGSISTSTNLEAASAFLRFLDTKDAKDIFEKYGFTMYME